MLIIASDYRKINFQHLAISANCCLLNRKKGVLCEEVGCPIVGGNKIL